MLIPPFASVTCTVIVATPDALGAGVITRLRFAPAPPTTMFAFGTTLALFEVAVTVSRAAGVSRSSTKTAIGVVRSVFVRRLVRGVGKQRQIVNGLHEDAELFGCDQLAVADDERDLYGATKRIGKRRHDNAAVRPSA